MYRNVDRFLYINFASYLNDFVSSIFLWVLQFSITSYHLQIVTVLLLPFLFGYLFFLSLA